MTEHTALIPIGNRSPRPPLYDLSDLTREHRSLWRGSGAVLDPGSLRHVDVAGHMKEHVGPLHDSQWVLLVDQHITGITVPMIEAVAEEMARSERLANQHPAGLRRQRSGQMHSSHAVADDLEAGYLESEVCCQGGIDGGVVIMSHDHIG